VEERDSILKSLGHVVPKHMAVIMDGNRRYGRERYGLGQELRGHRAGGELLHDFIGWCQDYGVKVLTVYAFSTENWNRPKNEVDGLMNVFVDQCPRIKSGCLERGVRVRVVASDFQLLEPRIQKMFRELEESTNDCTSFHLNLCVSYGGRSEITKAARKVCLDVAEGKIRSADQIMESHIDRYMLTQGFPDPDLVVRTSGEHRLSNFLLWQLAYAEMEFVQKHWPELDESDFVKILRTFSRRKRRFGK
jgi:undecaprenyl diphosphate synthase